MALIRIKNLKKSYNITKNEKQEVLKGVDLEFKSGDLVALLGESGCGKSTLLNILGGLDSDYTGSIVVKGGFMKDYTEKDFDEYRKKRVGLIFQNYNLIPHFTILENVKIAMEMSSIEGGVCEKRAHELLKLVGLDNQSNKMPNQLSGGQRQRVAIARSLANNPTILLADEPTGALDSESAAVVMEILKKIAMSGKLVLIVTHSQKVAGECGRIIKMEDGKIVSNSVNNKMKIAETRDKEINAKNITTKNVAKLSYKNIKTNLGRNMFVSVGLAVGILAFVLILCLSSGLTNYVDYIYEKELQPLQVSITKSNDTAFVEEDFDFINQIEGVDYYKQSYVLSNSNFDYNSSSGNLENAYLIEDNFTPTILYGDDIVSENQILINESFAKTLSSSGSLIESIGSEIELKLNRITKNYTISGIYYDVTENFESNNIYFNDIDIVTDFDANIVYIKSESITDVSAIVQSLTMAKFDVFQDDSTVSDIVEYIDMATTALMAVSVIAMFVSAIMIFIVLYISVKERTKEIGILRAIGSRKKDISKMFVFEAGMIGLMAGVFAVGACLVLSIITNIVCLASLGTSIISYNIGYYLLGVAISVVVSVVSGIAPANRASELEVVDCLRYE